MAKKFMCGGCRKPVKEEERELTTVSEGDSYVSPCCRMELIEDSNKGLEVRQSRTAQITR